jgi:hypothetical protein
VVGIIAGVVALVVAGIGVGVLLNRIGSQPVGLSVPTTSSRPPASAAASKYTAPLQDLALPMPADAHRETPRLGAADGSLALEDIVQEYGGTAKDTMRRTLVNLEFERGIFLAWTDAQGALVYLQLYQFHFEREAAAWSVGEQRSFDDITETTAGFDEILGGKWITTTGPDGRHAALAVYSKGDFSVTISVFAPGAALVDYVKRLAVDQYQRLP